MSLVIAETVLLAGVDSNGIPRLLSVNADGSISGGVSTLAGLSDVNITSPQDGHYLAYDAASSKWIDSAGLPGTGTVTSVALSAPSIFTVSGSPVTTSGTLTFSLNTQVMNTVFAGPTSGVDATPTFRSLVEADLGTGTGTTAKFLRGDMTWTSTLTSGLTINGALLITTDNTTDIGAAGANRPRTIYAGTSVVTTTLTGTLSTAAQPNITSLGTLASALLFTDNAVDIGATGATRPRTMYLGTSLIVQSATGVITFGTTTGDAQIARSAAATIRFGFAANATPVANTLTIGESSRSGTDTNTAGANGTLQPGLGTGTGTPAALILSAPVTVASGTGAQTYAEGFRVQGVSTAIGIGFYGHAAVARPSAYTLSNTTTNRTLNETGYTVDQLAQVLGTVIADLQSVGLFQ